MKKIFVLALFLLVVYLGWKIFIDAPKDSRSSFERKPAPAFVLVHGNVFEFQNVTASTVGEFLSKSGFILNEGDSIFPERETPFSPGMKVAFLPARTISLVADGREKKVVTTAVTSEEILARENISLDEDDMVEPSRETAVSQGRQIIVTRVEVKEEVKEVAIPFSTKTMEDDELSWRKTLVKQKGEKGVKQTTYRVSYHNGREVNRRVLKTETTKEPVEEIVTQGTYVKTGKSHKGAASWYAWTGTMAAANPWLPKGSYVRVTNVDNGKSVIVVINDRGPFAPGRIIDLDKVAFQKIASLGAGVINVKMEEIVN